MTLLKIGDRIINLDRITHVERRNSGAVDAPKWSLMLTFDLNHQQQIDPPYAEEVWKVLDGLAEKIRVAKP